MNAFIALVKKEFCHIFRDVRTMMTSISLVREREMGSMELLLLSPMRPALESKVQSYYNARFHGIQRRAYGKIRHTHFRFIFTRRGRKVDS